MIVGSQEPPAVNTDGLLLNGQTRGGIEHGLEAAVF
jgi:hypothetical protein